MNAASMSKAALTIDRVTPILAERSFRVGLVQINNSFSNQNYFPYSVGILQAYAQRHLSRPADFEFMLPVYHRLPVDQAVAQLIDADAVFFSAYVWNIRMSLAIAERLKRERPELLIVFGGPQVPNLVEGFIRANPFIDVAVHGEGEQTFCQILDRGLSGDWSGIGGISYVDDSGALVTVPANPRIKDMSVIPSPYTEGTFAPLMAANPQEHWIAMWETNRGCPFSCTFCDWGSAVASKVYQFDVERLYREIDWFADQRIEFIFCADANFGILPRDLDIARYAAKTKMERGYPQALSVQNTKNATSRAYDVQKTLADAGLNKGVTVSFQSVDPTTLDAIKRGNISTKGFQELQLRFTSDRIETYSDLILGLPGETYETFADGVSSVIDNGQHNRIQFNNLSILPNAEMGDPAYQQRYGMELVESKVVNIHGALLEAEWDIPEMQELVVATNTTPRADWVRTRAYCWWAALLHFDKILQIPLVLVHEVAGISYRELFELFADHADSDLTVLGELRQFFRDKAIDIQNGGAEYCPSEEWLGVWWPADEYVLIKLVKENKMAAFYQESAIAIERLLAARGHADLITLMQDAVRLNHALLKKPFQDTNLDIDVGFNAWEFYRAAITGQPVALDARPHQYQIDRVSKQWHAWDDWCREVVWYGNKKGAYLYSNNLVEREIAGHF